MSSEVPATWRGVRNHFDNGISEEVRSYFEPTVELIENYDWEVSLAFMFTRVEKAMNMMLYCGARKIHKAHSGTAYAFVDKHHMTRKDFKRLFKNVFGSDIPAATNELLAEAEKVRNKIIHGKSASPADQRKAIIRLLDYAEAMNVLVHDKARFRPFTPTLRGFTGQTQSLDQSTTSWLMRGLGFTGRAEGDEDAN